MKHLLQVNKDIGGSTGSTVKEVFNEAIAGLLVKHYGQDGKTKRTRGKKITPGKAITPQDLVNNTTPTTSKNNNNTKNNKKRARVEQVSSSSDDDDDLLENDF